MFLSINMWYYFEINWNRAYMADRGSVVRNIQRCNGQNPNLLSDYNLNFATYGIFLKKYRNIL